MLQFLGGGWNTCTKRNHMGGHSGPAVPATETNRPHTTLACCVLVTAPHPCTFLHNCYTYFKLASLQLTLESQCVAVVAGMETGPLREVLPPPRTHFWREFLQVFHRI